MRRKMGQCACGVLLICFVLPLLMGVIATRIPSNRPVLMLQDILGNESYLRENGYIEGGEIQVFIRYEGETEFTKITSEAMKKGWEVLFHFEQFSFMVLKMPHTWAHSLMDQGWDVYLNRRFRACMDVSVPVVKPAAAWVQLEAFTGYSINGSGIVVAVLDTGINTHPDLDDLDDNGTTTDPKVLLEKDFFTNASVAIDDNEHGTHVAGIIAGTGEQSGGARTGVAPGCYLLDGKILNAAGIGDEILLLRGIQWAIANGSDVINLSLTTNESGDGTDPFSQAVKWAVSQGVTVVVAAGNPGNYAYHVLQPGVSRAAITVGALDRDGHPLYSGSPFGPTHSFHMKPDILAPGQSIQSCDNDTSGYLAKTGTSQAAAHISGAVALLLQTHPSWTPAQIKDALMANAVNMGWQPYTQGAGRLYAPAAVNASVLMDAVADFTLFGMEALASQTITLTNLRPYPLTITHAPSKYGLNVSSPFVLPTAGSMTINVSINPTLYSIRRIWEYVNFTAEGKTWHLVATGINPALNLSAPPSILYNTTFQASLDIYLDDYQVDFLSNSYAVVHANTTFLGQVPISGNGTLAANFSDASLTRGRYELTASLYINQTLKENASAWLEVRGYNSSITISTHSAVRWATVSIALESSENVSGPVKFYSFVPLCAGWQYLGEIASPDDIFQLSVGQAPGEYYLKAVFEGSPTHEPVEILFILVVTRNWTPLTIFLVIFAGVVGTVTVRSYVLKRRRDQRAREEAIKAECEKEREVSILSRKLEPEIRKELSKGAAFGEPDVLPIPVGKQRAAIARALEELDARGDWQGTVRLLWATLNLEIPDLLPPELREQYAYRLGTLLMDHNMNADAATVLEAEIQRAGSKTDRMVTLLIEVFGPDRLNIPEKVLRYQGFQTTGQKKNN